MKKGKKFKKEISDLVPKEYLSRSGVNHWGWKGDEVGYVALHEWIQKICGIADHCDLCKVDKIPKGKRYWFEWSCKNKKYNRDIKNWWQLCIPCHRKHDGWREKLGNKGGLAMFKKYGKGFMSKIGKIGGKTIKIKK